MCLLVLGRACGGGSSAPGHTFEVITEDGVPTAVSSAQPKYEGELFTYEKVTEVRGDPDDTEAFLYDPYDLALDDGGNVYVAEQMNRRISVWDADGNYVRSIGHQGQGPGEFPFGPIQVVIRDGVVAVPMMQNGSMLRFRTDGTYLDTFGHESVVRGLLDAWKSDEGASVFISQRCAGDAGTMQCNSSTTLAGEDGEVRSTLETGPVPITNYGGGPTTIYLHGRRQVFLTTGLEPILRWYDLDGTLAYRARIDLPVEPVTQAERDAVIEQYDRHVEAAPEGRERDSWIRRRDAVEFPDNKGFWWWSTADDEGYLWLSKPRPEIIDYDANFSLEFRIVSPEGEYLGDTRPPPAFGTARIYRGHYLILVIDPETGEKIPTVYRLRPRLEGFVYP